MYIRGELFGFCYTKRASLVAQSLKNLPAMQEMQEIQVWSLGREDPLEEGMATHSSILAWWIPWSEEPRELQSIGFQRVRHDWSDLTCMHSQIWGSSLHGCWNCKGTEYTSLGRARFLNLGSIDIWSVCSLSLGWGSWAIYDIVGS